MLPRPPRVILYTVPSVSTSFAIRAALRTRSVTEMIRSILQAYFKHLTAATPAAASEPRATLRQPAAATTCTICARCPLETVP